MIFLAAPNYGAVDPQTMVSILNASKQTTFVHAHTSSFLTDGFNTQWCAMLNMKGISYFAMIHADIGTETGWIDTLIKEMDIRDLDILSVVMPIKDNSGDTSTAILHKRDDADMVTRIPLKTTLSLPDTFTIADVEKEMGIQGTLLINTGLWVARCGDWMNEFNGFRAESMITLNPKTLKYETLNTPEDWDFSLWAAEKGLKVGATTIIKATHFGKHGWKNFRDV